MGEASLLHTRCAVGLQQGPAAQDPAPCLHNRQQLAWPTPLSTRVPRLPCTRGARRGTTWGEAGYLHLAMTDDVPGACAMYAAGADFPIIHQGRLNRRGDTLVLACWS